MFLISIFIPPLAYKRFFSLLFQMSQITKRLRATRSHCKTIRWCFSNLMEIVTLSVQVKFIKLSVLTVSTSQTAPLGGVFRNSLNVTTCSPFNTNLNKFWIRKSFVFSEKKRTCNYPKICPTKTFKI